MPRARRIRRMLQRADVEDDADTISLLIDDFVLRHAMPYVIFFFTLMPCRCRHDYSSPFSPATSFSAIFADAGADAVDFRQGLLFDDFCLIRAIFRYAIDACSAERIERRRGKDNNIWLGCRQSQAAAMFTLMPSISFSSVILRLMLPARYMLPYA